MSPPLCHQGCATGACHRFPPDVARCHPRLPPAPVRSRTEPPAPATDSRQESHGGKPPVVQVVVVTVSGGKLVVDVEMLETVGDLKVSGLFK